MSAKAALEVMRKGLQQYRALPKSRRIAQNLVSRAEAQSNRFERLHPKDGLVLRVLSRDLPREDQVRGWRGKAFNLDYAWFTNFEQRWWIPDNFAPGLVQNVPELATRRLARLHFTDNVRGQTLPFSNDEMRAFRLTTKCLSVQDGVAEIEWQGWVLIDRRPSWALDDDRWTAKPSAEIRGLSLNLYGRGKWDIAKGRFTKFEMIAAGKRWGITAFNGRRDDSLMNPLGFLLTLADDSPLNQVPPAHWREYGWR
ncbi:MAG: hypothetical protein MUC92_14060 [Fimbriimonadaceae bacterium]|nr:hypothetical protein [Fimbriimonadaceae bacterium]